MPGPALPAHIRALGLEHAACPFFLLKGGTYCLRPDCLPVSFLLREIEHTALLSMSSKRIAAVAYLRTSSAANVGADKDSDKRQRATIAAFAKAAGYTIVDEFYDAAVSGSDPVGERPGFKAMLERIASNGVRIIWLRARTDSRAIWRFSWQATTISRCSGSSLSPRAHRISSLRTRRLRCSCAKCSVPSRSLRKPPWSPSCGLRGNARRRQEAVEVGASPMRRGCQRRWR